ncbi:hypothetical protein SmJEL517_g02821 [Synchytrium microbalum]|uniref:Dipeptidyl-peptidase V n=1 Tax=Synchytrium microbalum TaxID=1806994 RepID=A0A507C4S3_9FUNG|nr:uncharacterized protein SmJEL517_g02821 [Synchytrium microbalum]TPX34481.1 hypothetical protein SmJEL517_g02821 [Synchytrium microbalum]
MIVPLILGVIGLVHADVHPFTAQDLVKLNYVSAPVVYGKLAAFSVSHYDIESNNKFSYLSLLDLTSKSILNLTDIETHPKASSPFFINEQWLAFSSDNGSLYYLDVINPQEPRLLAPELQDYDVSNFKYYDGHLVFSAQVHKDTGEMIRKDEPKGRLDSGVLYEQLMVRHWDAYIDPSKLTQLWTVSVDVSQYDVHVTSQPVNLMKDTGLQTPVAPFGGTGDFDISPDGSELAFTAKVPGRDEAWNTNTDIYIVSMSGNGSPVSISAKNLGADHSPLYSPDRKYLAWLQMQTPQYESDLNKLVLLDRKTGKLSVFTKKWDRSIQSMIFSSDSKSVIVTSEDLGLVKIYKIDIESGSVTLVHGLHASGGLQYVDDEVEGPYLVFERSSAIAPPEIYKLLLNSSKGSGSDEAQQLTSFNYEAMTQVLLSEPESFTFKGYDSVDVSGWMFKPSSFNPMSTYPVAFLIHGGPEGAWDDSWSQRWNYQIFASAGFVVVAINPRGSTGYGIAFERGILNSWGLAPYQDLMMGLDHVLEKHLFTDPSRVVALGASFGGYMINWINGHTDRFKALVCHDGIFDTRAAYYTTEELWFPEYEFGGPEYEKPQSYDEWNPSKFVKNWKTPTLVIHSELDYRLTMGEGIGAFTALQKLKVPSKLLYFPDENHWVRKPSNSIRWNEEVLKWILQWTEKKGDEIVMEQ